MSSRNKSLLVAVLVALGHVAPAHMLYSCPMTGRQSQRMCCCSAAAPAHCTGPSRHNLGNQKGPSRPAALESRCCLVSRSPADAPSPAPQTPGTDGWKDLLATVRLMALLDGFPCPNPEQPPRCNFDRHSLDPGSRQAPPVPTFLAHCSLLI